MKKKNTIPISIVIPTLGNNQLLTTLKYISQSSIKPYEIIFIIPKIYKNRLNFLKLYKKTKYKIVLSKEKNQVKQRILGFKKSKKFFVVQMDDDIFVSKNCLLKLYKKIKSIKENVAIAPRYIVNQRLSSIYKKPNNLLLKFYHWLINSTKGFKPGSISLSGFNYADENKKIGVKKQEWLSGGIIIHKKENLILDNYYPYNFDKSYCEDVLHSLLLRRNNVKLIKYYEAQVSEFTQGNIVNNNLIKTLKSFFSEVLIRYYIVSKFNLSKIRLVIYYLIYFLRIVIKKIKLWIN